MIGAFRRLTAVVAVVATSFAVTGCTGTRRDAPTSTAPAHGSTPAATPEATTSGPSPALAGNSNGKNYTVTMTPVDGGTPDGMGKWQVQAGQLDGGDPAVVDAFNKASQASARYVIDKAQWPDAKLPWTFEASARVTFRNTAIAQVIGGMRILGAAPPTQYVSTIVIDSRTAQPITLADLFINEQDGLDRLSEQIKILADPGHVMPDETGNAPLPENFANWIPTAEGMEIYFDSYHFETLGRFNPTITVPWSALTDVLAPNMAVLAQA